MNVPGLTSDNLLIRATVAGAVVFGSLYVLDSFGVPGMFALAVLAALAIVITRNRATGPTTASGGVRIKVREL